MSTTGDVAKELGFKKVLVVTDENVEKMGHSQKAIDCLNEAVIETVLFNRCEMDAPDYTVQAGADTNMGVNNTHICTSTDILTGKVKISGKKVAVIGSGMTGVETAELLETQDNEVFVVEMADRVGPDASCRVSVTSRPVSLNSVRSLCHLTNSLKLKQHPSNWKKIMVNSSIFLLIMWFCPWASKPIIP